MNRDQLKYAMERVRAVAVTRKGLLNEKFTIEAKEPTDKAKLRWIREECGSIFLRRATLQTTLGNAFDFDDVATSIEFDSRGFNEEARKLRKERDKVLDEIMLGDAEKALKLIKEFCKGD